ncbi:hypothetical protein SBC1_08100 [Caballeronia sp. SBC1]|nr:hypothetical protein SBC1_08100 [Caballeronia sp. SBC1]
MASGRTWICHCASSRGKAARCIASPDTGFERNMGLAGCVRGHGLARRVAHASTGPSPVMVSPTARAVMLSGGVPDTQITRQGCPDGSARWFLRGASSARSFVRINGERKKSVGRGATQRSQRMPDDAEAVNGSGSALYGMNTGGGVVQVFTRKRGAYLPCCNLRRSVLSVQRQSVGSSQASPFRGAARLSITSATSSTRTISLRIRTTRRVEVPRSCPADSRGER